MVFFGTPFQNSKKDQFLEIIEKLTGLYKLPPKSLTKESKVLHDSFPKALGQHLKENKQAGVVAFYETGKETKLVDAAAAVIPSPDPQPEEATHDTPGNIAGLYGGNRDISKFDDKDDRGYRSVAGALQKLATVHDSQDKGSGLGRVFDVGRDVGTLIGGDMNGDILSGDGAPVPRGNVNNMTVNHGIHPLARPQLVSPTTSDRYL
ncbi:hypothetical protein F5B21DRAFT_354944 [Xylaria acuta]|nr:hypothetical protein F5B21DRAFT_354944 [Xylaria acuta]